MKTFLTLILALFTSAVFGQTPVNQGGTTVVGLASGTSSTASITAPTTYTPGSNYAQYALVNYGSGASATVWQAQQACSSCAVTPGTNSAYWQPIAQATGAAATAQATANSKTFTPQWTHVGTHTLGDPLATQAGLTNNVASARILEGVPFSFSALRYRFCNNLLSQSGTTDWNSNGISVDAQAELNVTIADDSTSQLMGTKPTVTFNGNQFGWVPSGSCVWSDPIPAGMAKSSGLVHYLKYAYSTATSLPAPTGLTLTGAYTNCCGAGLSQSTNYTVCVALDDPRGGNSLPECLNNQQLPTAATCTATGPTGGSNTCNTFLISGVTLPTGAVASTFSTFDCLSTAAICQQLNQHIPLGNSGTTQGSVASTLYANNVAPAKATLSTVQVPANLYTLGDTVGSAGGPASLTGESYVSGVDYPSSANFNTTVNGGAYYAPTDIQALPTSPGAIGVCFIGDSELSGTDDGSFFGFSGVNNQLGGWGDRAALNQYSTYGFDPRVQPNWGYINLANYGETYGTWTGTWGGPRKDQCYNGATTVVDGYGVNDINLGGSGTAVIANVVNVGTSVVSQGKRYVKTTIVPRVTVSSDGFATIANQSYSADSTAAAFEGRRHYINNWLLNTYTGTQTGVTPWTNVAGSSFSSNYNFNNGGDGVSTQFFFPQPFLCPNAVGANTEQVYVLTGGVPTLTTAYTYLDQTTLPTGQVICGGITMTTVPAASGGTPTLTVNYTPAPSPATLINPVAPAGYPNASIQVFDHAGLFECNSSGTRGTNGGFWCPLATLPTATGVPAITTVGTGLAISTYSTAYISHTGGWSVCTTTDSCRGYFVVFTGGGCGSNAVSANVISNTSTQLNLESSNTECTPTSSSTFSLYSGGNTIAGIHPAPYIQRVAASNLVSSGLVTSY